VHPCPDGSKIRTCGKKDSNKVAIKASQGRSEVTGKKGGRSEGGEQNTTGDNDFQVGDRRVQARSTPERQHKSVLRGAINKTKGTQRSRESKGPNLKASYG